MVAALVLAGLVVFAPVMANYGEWTPQGRYLFPVILPFAVLLCVGLASLWPGHRRAWFPMVLLVGLLVVDGVSLGTIGGYFYSL